VNMNLTAESVKPSLIISVCSSVHFHHFLADNAASDKVSITYRPVLKDYTKQNYGTSFNLLYLWL
jgi:hypothetical protein